MSMARAAIVSQNFGVATRLLIMTLQSHTSGAAAAMCFPTVTALCDMPCDCCRGEWVVVRPVAEPSRRFPARLQHGVNGACCCLHVQRFFFPGGGVGGDLFSAG